MTGSQTQNRHWTARFTGLDALATRERERLEAAGVLLRLPKGSRVFVPGQSPDNYILVVEGDVRVSQVSVTGREIVLYRVLAGESCALTTACLLGEEVYSAEAVAETNVEAVAVPRATFDDLMSSSAAFRKFVLANVSHRLTDLCKLVDEIAFQRMDVRLAHKILELVGANDELVMTHQQLATELGTAREVVSRQVHELQRRGWLVSGRGNLRILDRAALQRLAGESRE